MFYNECPRNNRYRILLGSVKTLILRAFRSARSNERVPAPFPRDGDLVTRADAALEVSALIDAGNWAEAERRIAHLICHRAAPGHIESMCGLGVASFVLGRTRRAQQYYREVLALDADCADAHFGLANIAQHAGKHGLG
jgi:Flp pilus assembly protein TadD